MATNIKAVPDAPVGYTLADKYIMVHDITAPDTSDTKRVPVSLFAFVPNGPLTGIILGPSGTIAITSGMWRELVIEGDGVDSVVSIGLTEGGSELYDSVAIPLDQSVTFQMGLRFKEPTTIYIQTTNTIRYEFYKA